MKNLNLKLSLLLAILLLSLGNVNAQKNNSCSVQLENLDIKLDVQEFFKQYFIEKKGNAKGDWATADLGKEIITEKDLQNKYYFEGDEKKKIAQRYYLKRYTEADKIVCYRNATFYTFEILATLNDKFVALTAKNHKIPTTSFKILLAELQKKAKLKKTESKNFALYTFDFGTYFVQLKQAKTAFRSESSIAMPGEKIIQAVDLELLILSKAANSKQIEWLNRINNN